jgi:hypothetical protein
MDPHTATSWFHSDAPGGEALRSNSNALRRTEVGRQCQHRVWMRGWWRRITNDLGLTV